MNTSAGIRLLEEAFADTPEATGRSAAITTHYSGARLPPALLDVDGASTFGKQVVNRLGAHRPARIAHALAAAPHHARRVPLVRAQYGGRVDPRWPAVA
jgi:hypothetical protein